MAKRALDVGLSLLLGVVALPVIIVAAIGAALALRAWPFFSHIRVGADGRDVRIHKIRTLPPNTPAYTDKYRLDLDATPAFCRFLRRLHLDELPQLFLVPLGRLSLVGPRPEMRSLHDQLDQAFAELRTSVRPGCSGLWQVGARSEQLIHEGAEYDRFYLAHASARLDLWIMWRTALMLVGIGRVVSLDDVPEWALGRHAAPVALGWWDEWLELFCSPTATIGRQMSTADAA